MNNPSKDYSAFDNHFDFESDPIANDLSQNMNEHNYNPTKEGLVGGSDNVRDGAVSRPRRLVRKLSPDAVAIYARITSTLKFQMLTIVRRR